MASIESAMRDDMRASRVTNSPRPMSDFFDWGSVLALIEVCLFLNQCTFLVVRKGRLDLFLCVHHEGAMLHDGLADRFS